MSSNPNKQGDTYTEIAGIAAPSSPASGSRRVFVDTATGELSTINSDGLVVPLESTTRKLASITGIDLKATGPTSLYTVPTGKTLIIQDIVILVTAASAIIAVPTFV